MFSIKRTFLTIKNTDPCEFASCSFLFTLEEHISVVGQFDNGRSKSVRLCEIFWDKGTQIEVHPESSCFGMGLVSTVLA